MDSLLGMLSCLRGHRHCSSTLGAGSWI